MVTTVLLNPLTYVALAVLYYVVPYLQRSALRGIPGPLLARFSNWWLLFQSRRVKRYQAVDALHKKYGPLVRIQPDHVSVADDTAINTIYGHGNGFLKAEFYDAFVGLANIRGLFNTRDRAQHTRKRKLVSHVFSPKSVHQFEPYIAQNVSVFLQQWDRIAASAQGAFADMDALHWFNYLAFDVIGDLAFGAPFGMLEKGADIAEIRAAPDQKPTFAPAVEVLNRRGEVSAAIGCMPWLRPWAGYLPDPFFRKGVQAIKDLAGIAIARVAHRLEDAEKGAVERRDLLARLMEGKDENGGPMGRGELTGEALTQLIAGSDTTSNTMCALLYHVTRTAGVSEKLRAEIETVSNGEEILEYDKIKDLEYLDCVIKETLRIHSTSAIGLPRVVPPGHAGVEIHGHVFPAGTVLSVPSYSIHHSQEIWGPNADDFDPDRFNKERLTERQKHAFIPFSYGPRACVGQNVAVMELAIFVSIRMVQLALF
ncbi:MAG: hypothetical protein Q9162_003493 [Coniocarpon cinnabarinum]